MRDLDLPRGDEVSLTFASWNQIVAWLLAVDSLQQAA